MKKLLVFCALSLLVPSLAFAEGKIEVGEDAFIKIKGYLQPTLQVDLDPAGSVDEDGNAVEGPDMTSDFFVRRAYLQANGQINKKVGFVLGLLAGNYGKGGTYDQAPYFRDAWIHYKVMPEFQVLFGAMKPAFTRHAYQSGASLHTLDLFGAKYVSRGKVSQSVRDIGVMFRGLVANKMIDYRIGFFDGLEPAGDNDMPRMVGRIGFNLFDADEKIGAAGTHLGKKKFVSAGLSYDVQPDGTISSDDGETALYWAAGFDLYVDYPLNDAMELVAMVVATMYGPDAHFVNAFPEGFGIFGDVGFRYETFEPLVAFEMFKPSDDEAFGGTDTLGIYGGFNWWMYGHKSNVKLQYGMKKVGGDDADWGKSVTIQSQLLF